MIEILIPISFFFALTIILSLFFMFRYRSRSEMQKTLRNALDKGQELTPELIEKLGQPTPAKHRDLRLALIWIALAIAFALFGLVIPDHGSGNREGEAQMIMLGLAAFPFFLGIAFLIMSRFTSRD